jgi:hypothetical protein
VPAGLDAGSAMWGFVRLVTEIREHVGRISGIPWNDKAVPRSARQEIESLLPALLDLVEAMAAKDKDVGGDARAAMTATRAQLGRGYAADPKHIGKAFAKHPDLGVWVAAALTVS